jgi:Rps23 Pro-64 3,4-dihydroxylase Tpa1-like proline 4-hydroxylase
VLVHELIENQFKDAKEPNVMTNFLEPADINYAIKFVDFLELKNVLWGQDNLRVYNCEYGEAIYFAQKYSQKLFESYNLLTGIYVHCLGFIKYNPGDLMGVHTDKMDEECSECVLSAVMYLNNDYKGGEIVFPRLVKSYHPEPGTCVSYPSLWPSFDHGVNMVVEGTRYALAWCFTSNPDKAFKPYLLTDGVIQ